MNRACMSGSEEPCGETRPQLMKDEPRYLCGLLSLQASAMIRSMAIMLILFVAMDEGKAQAARIVGTGTVSCATFLADIARNPMHEREYFSWAQGYMSGILMRAPAGKDENLDLTPPAFPVKAQLQFFREFCAEHQNDDFADVVERLYQRL